LVHVNIDHIKQHNLVMKPSHMYTLAEQVITITNWCKGQIHSCICTLLKNKF